MQLAMIGLGTMGANMVRRLLARRHECVVYDMSPKAVNELAGAGAIAASSVAGDAKLSELAGRVSDSGEADFQDKLLSAMRFQFGGHHEKKAGK